MSNMETYTRIREAMKEKNLTASQVAQAMGISPGTFSGIVNGNPTIGTLAKIADTIEIELKELIR